MESEVSSNKGILDIIVPIVPDTIFISNTFVLLLIFISLISGFMIWRRLMTPKAKARRRLAHLHRQSSASVEVGADTVFHVADIVKDGLELSCLSVKKIIPGCKQSMQQDWMVFVEKLDSARYSSEVLSKDKLSKIMHDAKRWLK